MKRDWDLIVRILEVVEEKGGGHESVLITSELPDIDEDAVRYHVDLMQEAGLIKLLGTVWDGPHADRLTMEGHDFLEVARNKTVWAKVKRRLAEVGGGASIEIVKALGLKFLGQQLGLDP